MIVNGEYHDTVQVCCVLYNNSLFATAISIPMDVQKTIMCYVFG